MPDQNDDANPWGRGPIEQIEVDGFLFDMDESGAVADCCHPTTTVTRRVIKNGAVQVVEQCAQCFRVIGGAIPKVSVADIDALPPFQDRAEDYLKARSSVFVARMKRQRAEWFEAHNVYLASPEWAKRRRSVMTRARGVCEGCLSVPATQVHHLSYDNWGDELLYQLVAICDACHEKAHSVRRRD